MASIWAAGMDNREAHTINKDLKTDVLVIGGGMAGILTAYFLTQSGVNCLLVEGKRVADGVTGNTTAKVTAQHGLIYDSLIRRFGAEAARQYYDANTAAIGQYKQLAKETGCDMEEKTAYVYSRTDTKKLEREAEAYRKLRIPFQWEDRKSPLPFPVTGVVGLPFQYQLHPLKLIHGLLPKIRYYENTFIQDVEGHTAISDRGTITAERIVLATHYPLLNVPGLYFMKLVQHRSYVLALERGPELSGMYIDENPKGLSFRNYGDYLLLGGGGHRTGQKGGGYRELESFAQKHYPANPIQYAWAAQDCMTLDQIPYVGPHRRNTKNLYVTTGFNKWGMTGAMTGALLLRDLLLTGTGAYEALLSPRRSMMRPALFGNAVLSAAHLIRPGRRCPHLGCSLTWNRQEKTWDCPCHGSRFGCDGAVQNNPAKRGIKVE